MARFTSDRRVTYHPDGSASVAIDRLDVWRVKRRGHGGFVAASNDGTGTYVHARRTTRPQVFAALDEGIEAVLETFGS